MEHDITPPWPTRSVTPSATVLAPPTPSARTQVRISRAARGQGGVIAAVTAATLVVATLLALAEADRPTLGTVSLTVLGLNVVAGVIPLWGIITDRHIDRSLRRAWLVMLLATGALLGGHLGRLSAADSGLRAAAPGLMLTAAALVLVAVALFPCGTRTLADRARLLLDVFVTAGAVTTLALTFMPSAFHGRVIAVGQPALVAVVGDALLFAAVAMIWLRGMITSLRDPLVPLVVACGMLATVELVIAAAHGHWIGTLAQSMHVLPYAFIGLAAARQRARLVMQGLVCGQSRSLSVLPSAAAGAVLLTLLALTAVGRAPSHHVIIGAALVGVAALVRQVLGVRTELHSREQTALEQADRRLAALVRHGSDMLTILELDTTVRYASPSHLQVMGIPAEALIGRRMDEQIHRDDLAAAERGFERLRTGTSARESLIVRLRDSTGRWRWIEAVGTNLSGIL